MSERVGGIIFLNINGEGVRAVGDFEWNTGEDVRTTVTGASGIDGYSETPQPAFIAGQIRVTSEINPGEIRQLKDATVTLELPTGAQVILRDAWFAGEGSARTEEGVMDVRFEGASGEFDPAT